MLTYHFVVFNDRNDNNINSWINVGYIGSYVLANCNVNIQYSFYTVDELEKALKEISAMPPAIIGLPVLQHNFYEVLAFCESIKKLLPNVFLVLGNKEAVCYSRYIMQNFSAIDAIVLGEGEITTSELCNRLSTGQDLSGCCGLMFRQGNEIITNPPRALVDDLDVLPFPYRSYRVGNGNYYNILGSRGCIGHCSFCEANSIFYKNTYKHSPVRSRSVANILDEIAMLSQQQGFVVANFLDSTFCSNDACALKRLEDLYTQIIERKLNFQFNINVRSEQVTEEFVDQLMKLSRVGLDSVLIGIETGNRDDIRIYNKGADLSIHRRAVKLLADKLNKYPNFIGVEYGFINFNPYSTLEKLKENIHFALNNNINLYPFDVMSKLRISGSVAITRRMEKDGLLIGTPGQPIVNPYSYRFVDDRVDMLYNTLNKAFDVFSAPNTSLVLSKLRRWSLHKEIDPQITTKVITLDKMIVDSTLHIFMKGLSIIEESASIDLLLAFASEQNERINELAKEVKRIENRVSVNLLKIGELPHHK